MMIQWPLSMRLMATGILDMDLRASTINQADPQGFVQLKERPVVPCHDTTPFIGRDGMKGAGNAADSAGINI